MLSKPGPKILALALLALGACKGTSQSVTDAASQDGAADMGEAAPNADEAGGDTAADAGGDLSDAGGDAQKSACRLLLECRKPCTDDACVEACAAQSTEEGRHLFNALIDCVKAFCCSADRAACGSAASCQSWPTSPTQTACCNCRWDAQCARTGDGGTIDPAVTKCAAAAAACNGLSLDAYTCGTKSCGGGGGP